jgi:hypothetical protein
MLSLLFIVRLRRMRIVNGTLGLPGGPGDVGVSSACSSGSALRRPAERPIARAAPARAPVHPFAPLPSGMRMVTPGDFFACVALPVASGGTRAEEAERVACLPVFCSEGPRSVLVTWSNMV